MPWRILKYWREILEFFEVASERFAKITAVAILLFLIMGAGIVVLYIDRSRQIERYEARILIKDNFIEVKDKEIKDLNEKLSTCKEDAGNEFMANFEKNVNTMQRVMDAREKSQDRQLSELEKIKKH